LREGELSIAAHWDGTPLEPDERASVKIHLGTDRLRIEVDAPFASDPPPPSPPGHTDGLWDFEVVELFLLGTDDAYLEVELGPWGHHLGLALAGRRSIRGAITDIDYRALRTTDRWTAAATLSAAHVPTGLSRCNAYAIRGSGDTRTYHACYAVPGPFPDFHRLEFFGALPWTGEVGRGS
jgi:hypothetical protein